MSMQLPASAAHSRIERAQRWHATLEESTSNAESATLWPIRHSDGLQSVALACRDPCKRSQIDLIWSLLPTPTFPSDNISVHNRARVQQSGVQNRIAQPTLFCAGGVGPSAGE